MRIIAGFAVLGFGLLPFDLAKGQATDSTPPSIALPAELARVLTEYEVSYSRGGAAVAELFTEDGFVLAGGRPPIQGRPAIAAYYGPSRGPLALRAFAYGVNGNTAYILGGYAIRRGERDAGKFTLTLRRRGDGRWMIVSDMDNGNTRPPRPASVPVSSADSAAIISVVQGLFDAMAKRDTAAARALLAPGAELRSLRVGGPGEPAVRRQSDTAFLRSLAAGRERLLERMWSPTIRVAGPIAGVWTMYDFHVDGRFSHCGVDDFTLLRSGSQWRLAGIVYTVQTEGCPPSPLGPPK